MVSVTRLKDKCACKGYTLDKFTQPIILLLLSKQECTGYYIIKQMGNYSICRLGSPDATGVYRQLRSMEEKGLVVTVDFIDENGSAKKKFGITDQGLHCLENWKDTLLEYQKSIGELIEEMDNI